MIESRWFPTIRCVAGRTVGGKQRHHVIRVPSAFVVRLVTGKTLSGCFIVAIAMAIHAVHLLMASREGKLRRCVIKSRWFPRHIGVTFDAIVEKRGNHVIRIDNLLVV